MEFPALGGGGAPPSAEPLPTLDGGTKKEKAGRKRGRDKIGSGAERDSGVVGYGDSGGGDGGGGGGSGSGRDVKKKHGSRSRDGRDRERGRDGGPQSIQGPYNGHASPLVAITGMYRCGANVESRESRVEQSASCMHACMHA